MNTALSRWNAAALTVLSLAALTLLYGAVYTPHHDLSGSILSGALANALGSDLADYVTYFPPAEKVWFSAADWFGRTSGIGGNLAVIVMTGFALLLSVGLGTLIRVKTTGAGPGFFLISFLFLLIVPVLYKNVFGLREHMVILGLWPWLVLRAAPVDAPDIGRGLRVVLGLWMGLMLTFKYLYALVVMLVELADALVQRDFWKLFRIENLVAGLIVAVYLGAWLGMSAEVREAIGAFRSGISANLRSAEATQNLILHRVAVVLGFLVLGRLFGASWRMLLIGSALIAGAIAVAWIQGRWYSHHRFPILVGFVAFWWLIGQNFPRAVHVVLALGFTLFIFLEFRATAVYQAGTQGFRQALHEEGIDLKDKRVGLLTQHPTPYSEIIVAAGGIRWTPSVNVAYVASELRPFDIPEQAGTLAPPIRIEEPGRALLHDQLLTLWEDHPPDVLIFDRSHNWPLRYLTLDWRHVLSADPRFNAIMDGYELAVSHDGDFYDFDYYVRAD